MSTAPSIVARDALRRWLRAQPKGSLPVDPGRMTRVELREVVQALGGDPNAIIHAHAQSQPTQAQAQPNEDTQTMPLDSTDPAPAAAPVADPDAMLDAIKDKLVEGGFGAVRAQLKDIIAKSQKPPVIKLVEKIVQAPPALPAGVHDLRPARTATWSELFGVVDTRHADKPVTVWDHPSAPKASPDYVFPQAETCLALTQLGRSEAARRKGAPAKHVLLIGPAGTGKSQWPREFAARTGRPFTAIPMSDGIEIDQLMGQTLPDGKGGARWQDGLLLAAIRQPGMVVCLDEVGGMRAAVGVALNGLLQEMVYYVPDTGERVQVARGVAFVATNNASLMDGGQARGYVGIARQNRAFADRFGASIEVGYAPEATEIKLLTTYTGCTPELAKLLVSVATLSRAKASAGQDGLTHGIGLRRLIAWAEVLSDGIEPELAFQATILNASPEGDHETLRQIALIAVDPAAIRAAVRGASMPKVGKGGADFTDVSGS